MSASPQLLLFLVTWNAVSQAAVPPCVKPEEWSVVHLAAQEKRRMFSEVLSCKAIV